MSVMVPGTVTLKTITILALPDFILHTHAGFSSIMVSQYKAPVFLYRITKAILVFKISETSIRFMLCHCGATKSSFLEKLIYRFLAIGSPVALLWCSPFAISYHQTSTFKACEHQTKKIDEIRAGAAGVGKGCALFVLL